MKLKDKVAIITGGTSGIGLETAKKFIQEGASVVICGRDKKRIDEARHILGDSILSIQADTSKQTDLEQLYTSTVDRFGKVDILITCAAGDIKFLPMNLIDEKTFDEMTTNIFKGTFLTIQKGLPYFNDGASIVVLSATGQSIGFPGSTVAAANKAAVCSLARGISADLLPSRGIRVNCISPGPIDTPLFDKLGMTTEQVDEMKTAFKQQNPLQRMGSAEEVADLALFLASDESSFIVGEEIKVSGGEGNFRI